MSYESTEAVGINNEVAIQKHAVAGQVARTKR
jgi:hypothetical protein